MEGILQIERWNVIKIEWFSFCRFDNFLRGDDKIGLDFIKVLKNQAAKLLLLVQSPVRKGKRRAFG